MKRMESIYRGALCCGSATLLWLLLCNSHITLADEAYRWQDAHGTTVYSEHAPPGVPSKRIPLESAPVTATVEYVIDGDTVILQGGERVRLLGINAPEVAHHNRPGEALGEEATEALRRLVSGRRVTLEMDREQRDHYGRRLAHLFLGDGRHINALLLQQGWVHVSLHWPNLRYGEAFMQLEREAREAKRGIWSLPRFQLQPVKRAKGLRNTFARLEGKVTRVDRRGKETQLHFGTSLVASIPGERLEPFLSAGLTPQKLAGHTLILRGWVGRYHGIPRVRLELPLQIENLAVLIGNHDHGNRSSGAPHQTLR